MNKSSKTYILIALAICYLGDYCAFVALLELSRQLFGAKESVLTFLIYSVPAVAMLIFSKLWSKLKASEQSQLVAINSLGFLVSGSLVLYTSKSWILICALLLGIIKEAARTLVNTLIKKNFPANEQSKLVSQAVTIRFVVMIVGGSIGAYLAASGHYRGGFALHAITFIIAGILIGILKTKNTTALATPTPASGSVADFAKVMNLSTLGLFALSLMSVGSFMSIEYPFLVDSLNVNPKYIGLVYLGHVLGAIFAQMRLTKNTRDFSGKQMNILSVLQITSFVIIGIFFKNLILISLQIGFCAFLMVLFESRSTSYLMNKVQEDKYSLYNIWLRSLGLLAEFIGALIAFAALQRYTLPETNLYVGGGILMTITILAFIKLARKFIISKKVISATTVAFLLILNSCNGLKDTEKNTNSIVRELTQSADESLEEVAQNGMSFAKKLDASLNNGDLKESSNIKFSSFYLPRRAFKLKTQANKVRSHFSKLDEDFNLFASITPYISWIYMYDSSSKSLLIYPSTNTQVLFGEDLIFDDFDFYKSAISNYPNGSFGGFKDDINGTGKIVIYTQAVKNKKYPDSNFTVSLDVNVSRLFKNSISRAIDNNNSLLNQRYFYIGYTKSEDGLNLVDQFSVDPAVFTSDKGIDLGTPARLKSWLLKLDSSKNKSTLTKKINGHSYTCSHAAASKILLNFVFCLEN